LKDLFQTRLFIQDYNNNMNYRQAIKGDIEQLQYVRNSVKENMLSDPSFVTDNDVEDYILNRGQGWVCEIDGKIVGFSIVSLKDFNVWALFIHPDFERKGIGLKLQKIMLDWYFNQTKKSVWLSTSPGTRAEQFYRKSGWKEAGTYGKGEIKFEMSIKDWNAKMSDK